MGDGNDDLTDITVKASLDGDLNLSSIPLDLYSLTHALDQWIYSVHFDPDNEDPSISLSEVVGDSLLE